ncbi:MAG: DUF1016 family protein [Bacteroidales bacterium]|nr:DUF1016 family protein [Bacteroidales bacterium]
MSDLQTYAEAVKVIKDAILRSQYRAASSANKEQLSLYYGIGCYVSKNSRKGFWGKSAIETISQQLQKELPGLRGFSATNIKNMRSFYEEWSPIVNRQPMADENKAPIAVNDLELNSLVAVELKSGKFRSSYLGQLSTYLSALDAYVRKSHENPAIGILLCRDMNQSFVEFAIRDYDKPMGVATYRATKDMPERLRNALPDIEELKKLL